MSKKLIISICTSTYQHQGRQEELPVLKTTRQELQRLFTGQLGYEGGLEEISENPTAQVMNMGLSRWFHAAERNTDDLVVIYYTGHGEIGGSADRFFLLTTDFEYPHYTGSAFPLDELGDMIFTDHTGHGGHIRQLLLIVDSCYSGAGSLDLMEKLGKQFKRPSDDTAFYVLAAAFPEQIAMKGLFVNSLKDILNDPATAGVHQRSISVEQLTAELTRRLKPYKPMLLAMFAGEKVPEFFPNRFFREGLAQNLTQEQVRTAIAHPELTEFWGPRSRGVDAESQPGWYFSGRKEITKEVSDWFADPDGPNLSIITGQPGAGKSAFLSRFVAASDPGYRARMPAGVLSDMSEVFSAVNTSVFSRNKTFGDIVAELAQTLRSEQNVPSIAAAITARAAQEPYRIVLDALDEARQPVQLIRDLIGPLAEIKNVKILVGTRQEFIRYFKGDTLQKHIDDEQYTSHVDIRDYALTRLGTDQSGASANPFLGREDLATAVAEQIAAAAYPNFLLAKLLVDNLLKNTELPAQIQGLELPATVATAFSAYFQTFGDREEMVRDLLLPLALAEGSGLPWGHLWAAVAAAITRVDYSNADISTLMQIAGSLIVESTIEGLSVYRLYHQALADTLLNGADLPGLHRKVYETLYDVVPLHFDGSGRNWQLAGPYSLNYLSTHAGKAGMLSGLVHDAGFLLNAQPDHLSGDLKIFEAQVPAKLRYAFKNILHLIKAKPKGEAAPNLLLQAFQLGYLAELDFSAVPPSLFTWKPDWVIWDNTLPHQVIADGKSEIYFSTVTEYKGSAAALVGRQDGSLEIWNLLTGECVYQYRPPEMAYIREMALLETTGGTLLVSRGASERFSVIEIDAKRSKVVELPEEISAFCLIDTPTGAICLTVSHEKTLLNCYTLPEFKLIPGQNKLLSNYVYYLLPQIIGGKQHVWVAGDFRGPGEPRRQPAQHLLTVPELQTVWQDEARQTGIFHHIQPTSVLGWDLLVVNADTAGKAELWELWPPKLLFQDIKDSEYTAIYFYEGSVYKLNVSYAHFSVAELSRSGEANDQLQADLIFTMPAAHQLNGYRFLYFPGDSQRPMLLGRDSGHLNIWDIQEIMAFDYDRTPSITTMKAECSTYDEKLPAVFFIGGKNGILELDLETGVTLRIFPITEFGDIKFLVHTSVAGKLIGGTERGQLMTIYLDEPGRPPEVFAEYDQLVALRVLQLDQKEMVAASVGNDHIYHVEIIDPATGDIFTNGSKYGLRHGQGDKALFGLAVLANAEGFRLAFASRYGQVMIADTAKTAAYPAYQTWKVPYTGNEYVRALTISQVGQQYLLAAGTDDGNLAVWDLDMPTARFAVHGAHLSRIKHLLFVHSGTKTVLISAGLDGNIKIWSPDLRHILSVEVGSEITTLLSPAPDLLIAGTEKGIFKISLLQVF